MKINIQKLSKYLSLIAVIVFGFSFLTIPSFASSSFSEQPYPIIHKQGESNTSIANATYNTGFIIGTDLSNGKTIYGAVNAPSDFTSSVYTFIYNDGGSYPYITVASPDNTTPFSTFWAEHDSSSGNNKRSTSHSYNELSLYSSEYSLYYFSSQYGGSMNWSIPVFNSLEDGLSALSTIANGGAPHKLSLSIPAGNALVVDISNLSTVEINASIITEIAHPSSWYTNQYYSFSSSYPSNIGNRPSNANTINWTGYGQTTIFNRYKSFYWNNTVASSAGYICITNPYASLDEYDQSFNPTINVTFSQAKGYKYYQLTGGISSDGNIGQQSDGTTASGTYDDSTGQWSTTNDETGLPWTPQEGGGNLITTNSINDWLKTIATQISNFFQGAIGAVTTLVNAGSAFIHTLISLYSWLPAPVYAVLSSALILVITIGVIKVFI